jgi:hypothetical protein
LAHSPPAHLGEQEAGRVQGGEDMPGARVDAGQAVPSASQ